MGGWIQTAFGDGQAGVQHHEHMTPLLKWMHLLKKTDYCKISLVQMTICQWCWSYKCEAYVASVTTKTFCADGIRRRSHHYTEFIGKKGWLHWEMIHFENVTDCCTWSKLINSICVCTVSHIFGLRKWDIHLFIEEIAYCFL